MVVMFAVLDLKCVPKKPFTQVAVLEWTFTVTLNVLARYIYFLVVGSVVVNGRLLWVTLR